MSRKPKTILAIISLVATVFVGAYYAHQSGPKPSPQSEAAALHYQLAVSSGCSGASCNGKDPAGLCDDGITVASMNLPNGFLELRYSRSCKANWGRFTVATRTGAFYTARGIALYPRVTVWNPGGPSYGVAHLDMSILQNGPTWSKMTNGNPTACTGVEILESGPGGLKPSKGEYSFSQTDGMNSEGWAWGPCV